MFMHDAKHKNVNNGPFSHDSSIEETALHKVINALCVAALSVHHSAPLISGSS